MTTYEEISTCPVKNREFWTEHARLNLTCYRIHKRDGDVEAARLERYWFRKNMKSRREMVFFNGDAK